jgi:hypothetical protein
MSVDAIVGAATAPLMDPVGWQGLAYGLLGLRTVRKLIDFARDNMVGGRSDTNGTN